MTYVSTSKSNFEVWIDESNNAGLLCVNFTVKKTIKMRIKWWLFCKVFPFKYRWL